MKFLCSVVLLAGMVPCGLGQLSQGGFFQVSVMCATESRRGWARVFANGSEGWKAYDSLATIPAGSTGVFQPDGALLAVDHQLRTEWGWGYGTLKRTDQTKIETVYSRFVDLRSGREVEHPERLKHRSDARLDTDMYASFGAMPFARLFEPLQDSEKYYEIGKPTEGLKASANDYWGQ